MHAAEVKHLRARLNASQAVFARYCNVSTKLVQAWEANRRNPDGPALVLLRLFERDPSFMTVFDTAGMHETNKRLTRLKKRSRPRPHAHA